MKSHQNEQCMGYPVVRPGVAKADHVLRSQLKIKTLRSTGRTLPIPPPGTPNLAFNPSGGNRL